MPCSPLSLSRTPFLSLHVVLIPAPPLNKSVDLPREPPGRSPPLPPPAPGHGSHCAISFSPPGADGAKLDPCLVWTLTRFAFPFPSKRARQRRGNALPPAGRIDLSPTPSFTRIFPITRTRHFSAIISSNVSCFSRPQKCACSVTSA